MTSTADHAVAIVGVGAILPDAPDAGAFWDNVREGHYAISEVDPARWDPALYYDPDPKAPEKTYSKIGGWVRDWDWDPLAWKLPIPPKVADAMDDGQKWAVACTRMALADAGWPDARARPRAHRGDPRQRDGGREALPDRRCASPSPSSPASSSSAGASPRCPPTCAPRSPASCARNIEARLPRDHRGHDARRAGQLHRRPHRQPVQPARPELHRRRRLRLGDGGDGRGDRGPRRARVRRRHHRRRRPQHGRRRAS